MSGLHLDRRASAVADRVAHYPGDHLLTRAELAEWCGVTYCTTKRWDRTGLGPRRLRAGRKAVRYRKDDVLRWLEACAKRASRSEATVG